MKIHRSIPYILIFSLFLILSSCRPPIPTLEIPRTLVPGDCSPSGLVAPQAHSPSNELVPSLLPVIQWFYPENCEPESYRLEIAMNGNFNATSTIVDEVEGDEVPWTLTDLLFPATVYQWHVAAQNDTFTGPFSPSPWFWTGPICDPSDLNPPMLVDPGYGVTIQDDSPELAWTSSNNDCLPEGYHFEVASDYQFMNIAISGDGPGPGTSFETAVPFLNDCGLYYWWVAAQVGGVLSDHNISYFYTDFDGLCPQLSCDSTQLIQPDPLYPINGEIVTSIADPFRFQWEYNDPTCIPDGYYFEVYSGVDFANTSVGEGFALDSRDPGWGPIPELPSYVNLPDCMTFNWHVAALQGPEVGPFSNEATFITDYNGICNPPASEEISFIAMACLSDERMMVTFEFPSPPEGSYQATIDGVTFPCQALPDESLRLFCVGPMAQQGILAEVRLLDLESGAVLLKDEISILCAQEEDGGDGLLACSTLDQVACISRSDCKWVPSIFSGPGHCETN